MQLLLNPATLLPGHETKPEKDIPFQLLLNRYASAAAMGQSGSGRQIVIYPAGSFNGRPIVIGLSISQMVEISVPLMTIPIPGVNPAVSGLSQWRGCPVPVINLQATLGYEAFTGPVSHFLIVRDPRGAGVIALPVVGRVHSQRLPLEHRPYPLPDKEWADYVLGVFALDDRLLVLPRIDAVSGLKKSA